MEPRVEEKEEGTKKEIDPIIEIIPETPKNKLNFAPKEDQIVDLSNILDPNDAGSTNLHTFGPH